MLAGIEIRRNADGVTRSYQDTTAWDGDYIWSEGNFACDCNRGLLFAYAANEDDPDYLCGDTEFSVRISDGKGVVLYEDGWFTDKRE